MIESMTGFAGASATVADIVVAVELRATNSRFLDIAIRLPADLRHLEDHLRGRIGGKLTRGRIEAEVKVDDPGAKAQAFDLDQVRADGLAKTLFLLKELGIDVRLGLSELTGPAGVLRACAPKSDLDLVLQALDQALGEALAALVAMRRREGQAIAGDLARRLSWMDDQVTRIETLAAGLPGLFAQKLAERLAAVNTQGVVDPQRLAQEVAVLADRCDISEEVVRARSHIDQFALIMGADEPAGRKLNFLIQELNREFNTIGSKAGQAQIAHLAVDLKSELEKIREQVQNIE